MALKFTLAQAKIIADRPEGRELTELQNARAYLAPLLRNGGVKNSERATERLMRRIDSLDAAILKMKKAV